MAGATTQYILNWNIFCKTKNCFIFEKVVTVSANSGFVRAAQGQGINLAVIIHESRALTEGKMPSAVPLNKTEWNILEEHLSFDCGFKDHLKNMQYVNL